MKDLIRHRIFIATFLGVYFSISLISLALPNPQQLVNVILASEEPIRIIAGTSFYGFPLTYYVSHCFGDTYYYSGLLGNILFAAILGTILGLIFSYLWKNLTLRIKVKQSPRKPRKKKR